MASVNSRWRRSVRLRGHWRTLRLAALWCAVRLRHPGRAVPPGFDLEFGLATDRNGDKPGERATPVQGVEYGPVDLEHFAELMALVEFTRNDFVFCDFGCGRGRALMLASAFPFRQIRGVEYDRDLARSAQCHLERWARRRWPSKRCHDFGVEWADATGWDFPIAPSVFYFNEPLNPPQLAVVAARIRASLAAHPRDAYVLYLGDWGAPVWEAEHDFALVFAADDRRAYRWQGRA